MRTALSLCAAVAAALLGAAAKQALAATPQEESEPPPPPPEPEPPELAGDVRYRADRIFYDTQSRRVLLDGNVVIERGEGRLYAPRGEVDRVEGRMRLEGGVLAIEGLQVMIADVALVDLRSSATDLTKATVYLKDRTAGPQLPGLKSLEAARTAGKNSLILHGSGARRLADGSVVARDVSLTPCDCAGPPDYQVLSPEAEIRRDRATLRDPKLDVFGLGLPVGIPISLPLTDRQSGLLAPRFGYQLTTGFGIVQPLFVTLGRSWDVTVAPGLFTGARYAGNPGIGSRTVRGPRLDTELRGAVNGTSLRVEVDLIKDFDQDQSTAIDSPLLPPFPQPYWVPKSSAGRGLDGLRGTLRASERTEAAWGHAALDGTIATDAMMIVDTQPATLDRVLDALRTDAGLWTRLGPATLGADATLLQDVRITDGGHPDRRLFGAEARRTMQRLPAVFAQLPPQPVAGPLLLSGELSAVRYMPLRSMDPQEKSTGFGPTDLNAGLAAAPAVAPSDPLGLARGSVVRFDAAPRLEANLASGAAGALSAFAGGRADAWVFDGDPARDRRRLYGVAGVRAETELSRAYGNWLHTVAPSLQLRGVTPALQSGGPPVGDPTDAGGPNYAASDLAQQGVSPGVHLRDGLAGFTAGVPSARRAYDEIDGAAPLAGLVQAVARVDQAVWLQPGAGRAPVRLFELTLAQDAVLADGSGRARVAEAWAQAAVHLPAVAASVRAQLDWSQRAFTGLAADGTFFDGRGDNLHAGLMLLRNAASELMRAGVDELFSSARLAIDPGGLIGSASAGFLVRLPFDRPPLSAGYTYERHLGEPPPAGFPDTVHHFVSSIDTPCRCAGVNFALDLPSIGGRLQAPAVRFVLDLKQLGAFGSP